MMFQFLVSAGCTREHMHNRWFFPVLRQSLVTGYSLYNAACTARRFVEADWVETI
jgi:hypothetical protein